MNYIIQSLFTFAMPVRYCQNFLSFRLYIILIIFVILVVNGQYAFAPTFKDIWWLGRSPTADQKDSEGIVIIYYTYPKKVETGSSFAISVTLENRKDEAVVANWLAFSNVSVSLRNYTDPEEVVGKESRDDGAEVVRPGGKYSHLFHIKAADKVGLYLPFLEWTAWFGPGTTVLENFQYKSEYYYEKTDRKFGIITKDELPPIYVVNSRPKKSELGIEIDDPFGKIKPVDLQITSKDKLFDEAYKISNGERKVELPSNMTYDIKIDQIIEMVPGQIRANFTRWSDGNTSNPRTITMDQNKALFALYETQYKLDVKSNADIPDNGSAWYDSGSVANYRADPVLPNNLQFSFDHWTGDISSDIDDIPVGHLVMDGPKELTANFRADNAGLWAIFATGLGTAGAGVEIVRERHRIKRVLVRAKNSL